MDSSQPQLRFKFDIAKTKALKDGFNLTIKSHQEYNSTWTNQKILYHLKMSKVSASSQPHLRFKFDIAETDTKPDQVFILTNQESLNSFKTSKVSLSFQPWLRLKFQFMTKALNVYQHVNKNLAGLYLHAEKVLSMPTCLENLDTHLKFQIPWCWLRKTQI